MYRTSYNPYNQNTMYRSSTTTTTANQGGYYDERGFWVPFVVGGKIQLVSTNIKMLNSLYV